MMEVKLADLTVVAIDPSLLEEIEDEAGVEVWPLAGVVDVHVNTKLSLQWLAALRNLRAEGIDVGHRLLRFDRCRPAAERHEATAVSLAGWFTQHGELNDLSHVDMVQRRADTLNAIIAIRDENVRNI